MLPLTVDATFESPNAFSILVNAEQDLPVLLAEHNEPSMVSTY